MKHTLTLKKVHPRAEIPAQRDGDVGFDIHSVEDTKIEAGKTVKLRTGLALCSAVQGSLGGWDLPIFLKVEDRSSMAAKGLFTHGGIIDPTYRGEFHVVLHNSTAEDYEVKTGDRIAQLVLYTAGFNFLSAGSEVVVVEGTSQEETTRGAGGFGSTGV